MIWLEAISLFLIFSPILGVERELIVIVDEQQALFDVSEGDADQFPLDWTQWVRGWPGTNADAGMWECFRIGRIDTGTLPSWIAVSARSGPRRIRRNARFTPCQSIDEPCYIYQIFTPPIIGGDGHYLRNRLCKWNMTCGLGQWLYYFVEKHEIHGDLTENGTCRDFLALGRPSLGATLESCGNYEDFQSMYPLENFEPSGKVSVEFRSNNQSTDRGFLISTACITPTLTDGGLEFIVKCEAPFVGNGVFCTLDSDQDGYPDEVLRTCTEGRKYSPSYCKQDNCPTVYNPQQNINACVIQGEVFRALGSRYSYEASTRVALETEYKYSQGAGSVPLCQKMTHQDIDVIVCKMEVDDVWNIQWGFTAANSTAVQPCGLNTTSFATRYCDKNGNWAEASVDDCESSEFRSIREVAEILFNDTTVITSVTVSQVAEILVQLANATEAVPGERESIYPRDLNTANHVLTNTIGLLIRALNVNIVEYTRPKIDSVADLLNNILHERNSQGWKYLQRTNSGSQVLLKNAELFGNFLARIRTGTEESVIPRENIVFWTTLVDATSLLPEEDQVQFSLEGLANFSVIPPSIAIPKDLLIGRQTLSGNGLDGSGSASGGKVVDRQSSCSESTVPVVNIAFRNLQHYLSDTQFNSNGTEARSLVISSQVGVQMERLTAEKQPIQLNFTIQGNTKAASNVRCTFWNFSDPIGTGGWSVEGLTTDGVDGTSVICSSNHLTSFVVLVDVTGGAECQAPFVGDGEICTLDSDQDGYPDEVLRTCTEGSTESYCQSDNCPTVYNPQQNLNACVFQDTESPDIDHESRTVMMCPMEVDDVWHIQWGFTAANSTAVQPCGLNTTEFATRYCDENGNWADASVDGCESSEFRLIQKEAEILFNDTTVITSETISQALEIVEQLANATEAVPGEHESIYPCDLNTANYVLSNTIDVLIRTLDDNEMEQDTPSDFEDPVVDSLNNLLHERNSQGWRDLQRTTVGSQVLLNNAELFGNFLANSRNQTGELIVPRENIVLRTTLVDATEFSMEDQVQFSMGGFSNFSGTLPTITIPRDLLAERQSLTGKSAVPVVNIVFQNLQHYLSDIQFKSNGTEARSLVISSQVGVQMGPSTSENPIQLSFTIQGNTDVASNVRCAFWNFSDPIGTGGWSVEGLTTDGVDGTSVMCSSNHLTSFVVLVDVTGRAEEENESLKITSYIGCAISLVCLLFTIMFFLAFRKTISQQDNRFIHLNLAIALFVGYLVFCLGIELGTGNKIGCKAVAALLQYFFLSAFCWMLCEGIMLYLKLVVVFSTFSNKRCFFFVLGWGMPFVFVYIGLTAFHKDYAVYNDSGDMLYCWISAENGAIWVFVAPVLLIILINSAFLVVVLLNVVRARKEKIKHTQERGLEYKLVVIAVKASIILLPLLGLTWVFGLFAVNENTVVFAWLFTIFNSLQGLFIFYFHVLKTDERSVVTGFTSDIDTEHGPVILIDIVQIGVGKDENEVQGSCYCKKDGRDRSKEKQRHVKGEDYKDVFAVISENLSL